MTDDPLVWHYGLMAERWAEFVTQTPELDFFLQAIERFGQPVLDLACGTGRLLLPMMRSGIDIDGCDLSQDMLDQCRRLAAREGIQPQLFQGAMHAFEPPRRYKTIYICGSFGLAGGRQKDLDTLQCCFTHLEDNGALLLNIQAEYVYPEAWELWMPENRHALPEPWPEDARSQIASDGSQHRAYFRMTALDPLEQTYTRQARLEKWVSGELVASETHTLKGNIYFKNELSLMLKMAGFREITIVGDYKDPIATREHEELVFTAIK
jgi:SAM-dependent methyltransferase